MLSTFEGKVLLQPSLSLWTLASMLWGSPSIHMEKPSGRRTEEPTKLPAGSQHPHDNGDVVDIPAIPVPQQMLHEAELLNQISEL